MLRHDASDMNKIDYRFKFLYVIGMVAVIFSHCGQGISFFYDWFPPGSFHLALFLFCSGYFYKETSTDNILKYILHKARNLIVPLYLWNLFYGVFVAFISNFGFTIGGKFTLYNILIAPITNGEQFYYNLGGWYVIPLFMIQVINVLVRKMLNSIHVKWNEWIYFFGYLTLGLIGVCLSNYGYSAGAGIILTRILCMMPFYEFGILYKSKLEKVDNFPNIVYFSFIFIIQLFIITFNKGAVTYSLAWCSGFPDNVFLPYIQSYIAIMFWLRISRILLPVIQDNKYIKLIGDNTYTIMINQFMGFMFVNTFFAFIHKYTVFCSDFNISEFKGKVWYYYLPQGIGQWYLVYGVAGIVVPLIMQFCVNKIKDRLVRIAKNGTNRYIVQG